MIDDIYIYIWPIYNIGILPNNNPKTYKMTANALERCYNNF